MDYTLLPEQYAVLEQMMLGRNVFASGKAGCGKSRILSAFYEYAKCKKLNAVFLAPTGMAALALPEAMTIHSFFEFPTKKVFVNSNDVSESVYMKKKLEHVDTIIIDEISMVRADLFQAMDISLRKHTGCVDHPFGGKQVIVVGDYNQLPPVIDDERVGEFINYYYGGIFSFCAPAWDQLHFQNFFLTHVIRQTDPDYIEMLDALRTMKPGLRSMLQSSRFRVTSCASDEIALCCRNRDASAINEVELARIEGGYYASPGILSGYFSDLPTDYILKLKPSARIMVIQNQRMSGGFPDKERYMNGELGSVLDVDLSNRVVNIRLDRGQREVKVGFAAWDDYRYEIQHDERNKPILCAKPVGSFYQFPLKAAWATSIHKAQGQTLEKAHLRLGRGCFSPGQLYTALTRVRGFDSLTLDRTIQYEDALIDPQVLAFHQKTFPEIY